MVLYLGWVGHRRRGCRWTWLSAAVVIGTCCGAFATEPSRDAWLQQRIADIIRQHPLSGARVGVMVQDARDGHVVARVRESEAFSIASNAKLITAAVALFALGPEYRFKTVLYAARPQKGVIPGNLYLKGYGDPSFESEDLWRMVVDLKDQGIQSVRGGLMLDESYFDAERLPPLFDASESSAWYRQPVGAISLDLNMLSAQIRAGNVIGGPARVVVRPHSDQIKLVNNVLTVGGRRRNSITLKTREEGGRLVVEVQGRVRFGARVATERRRINDPGAVTGQALVGLLATARIHLARPGLLRGKTPDKLQPLVIHRSQPLGEIIRLMNKHSNNFIAEQLLKVIGAEAHGAPATSENGLDVVARYLEGMGLSRGSYTFKNGSGLYNATSFTPKQIATILTHVHQNFRIGPDFVASLPQSGVDGTLGHRMVGTSAERYVRAKTGTLSGVVSLSGYAGSKKRAEPLVFSVLINGFPKARVLQARRLADAIAEATVSALER